jgi:bacteriocin biosynthesis cyclodehydratase domain-containing protein
VEDVGLQPPAVLSERERERYDRGRNYYRWVDLTGCVDSWAPQLALRESSVLVLGVGGTGGAAAMALVASGVGRVHVIDDDHVELSNLNRQVIYRESDIGAPKAVASVRALRALNSDVEITGEQRRITGVDDLAEAMRGHDLLVACADRPREMRVWANRACLATGMPWVESGYHGPRVSVGVFRPGHGACYECLRRTALENPEDTQDDVPVGYHTHAVTASLACLSGHYAAHFALALLTGFPSTPVGRIQMMNLIDTTDTTLIDFPQRPDCPACGHQQDRTHE